MQKKIIVAGAGHGGVAVAALLAKAGPDVTVYERRPREELGYDWFDAVTLAIFHKSRRSTIGKRCASGRRSMTRSSRGDRKICFREWNNENKQ